MEDRNKQKDFTHAQTSSDLEEQERILQYYKYFIVNCTSKGKSIKNYTDFKTDK